MKTDVAIAEGIAEQVRSSAGGKTWRKVGTILSEFGLYRLTPASRRRIAHAFTGAALTSDPSMLDVERQAILRLSVDGMSVSEPAMHFDGAVPVGITIWEPSGEVWTKSPSISHRSSVSLVDVDLSLVESRDLLGPWLTKTLVDLDDDTLADLLDPDSRASFKRHLRGTMKPRASLFLAGSDESHTASVDQAVVLTLRLVEFAVGGKWLLIARHPAQLYVSGSAAGSSQPVESAQQYVESLQDYGLANATSPQSAAFAVISQGVDSFASIRAEFAQYLDTWRTVFNTGSRDSSLLTDLQATLPLVVDALEPLRRPTLVDWVESGPRARARDLGDQVQRNLDALNGLQDTTGAAIRQADQAHNERYQRSLATLAALLLAPALVASIFGGSAALQTSNFNLVWLFVAMLLAGFLTQVFINLYLKPGSTASLTKMNRKRLRAIQAKRPAVSEPHERPPTKGFQTG